MKKIIKIQWPLCAPRDGTSVALVRDESHAILAFMPATEALREKMGGKPTAYFEAEVIGKMHYEVGDPAPEQPW